MAVYNPAMHRIGRVLESNIYESNDSSAEFSDESYAVPTCGSQAPPRLAVTFRYGLKFGNGIAFRIQARVIFGAFEEDAGNAVRVFRISRTDPDGHKRVVTSILSVSAAHGI